MRVEYTVEKSFSIDNTDAAFLAEAVRTVNAKGADFSFSGNGEGCTNVACVGGGEWVPVCLIGTILVNMGVPPEWFDAVDAVEVTAQDSMGRLGFSDRIMRAARAAQICQDNNATWGEALTVMTVTYAEHAEADSF